MSDAESGGAVSRSIERGGRRLVRAVGPDGTVGYYSPSLRRLGVPHVFTTRAGGAYELDLRDPEECALDRLRDCAGSRGARVLRLRQVHGDRVVDAEQLSAGGSTREGNSAVERFVDGDALVSGRVGELLLVRTADCVSVLLAADSGRRVAAVHAGWRGIMAGVVERALAALGTDPTARRPDPVARIVAAIGPCLSTRRFEVGPEVSLAFERAGLGDSVVRASGTRDRIDLRGAVGRLLAGAGVEVVDTTEACTWDDDEFFSFRRDVTHGGLARTGHMGAAIGAVGGGSAATDRRGSGG